jgi:secreted Zn-dependent insulinase-like peptidase
MQVRVLSGSPKGEKMFDNIKEDDKPEIKLSEVKELIEKYFLQELRKGEHPDDIDFDFMDITGEILDYLSTDKDMCRVDFKHSTYEEKEAKNGKRNMKFKEYLQEMTKFSKVQKEDLSHFILNVLMDPNAAKLLSKIESSQTEEVSVTKKQAKAMLNNLLKIREFIINLPIEGK